MQKWRAVLFVFLGIFTILGFGIGILFVRTGIGSIKISRINLFDVFELVCLGAMSICVAFDLTKINRDRKKFGRLKNDINNLYAGRTRIGTIALLCLVIFEVVNFAFKPTLMLFLMIFVVAELALMFIYHDIQRSGVNENGILFWGVYYPWKQIKGYTEKAPDQINIVLRQKITGTKFENKIWIKVKNEEYDTVLDLFRERVSK